MKRIFNAYAERDDITFIMEDTLDAEGNIITTECIGWYFGEPDEEANQTFAHKLKAIYDYKVYGGNDA